jgi:hypothetical protein
MAACSHQSILCTPASTLPAHYQLLPPPPRAGNPFVFKFSLTLSSGARPLSKNGVHWAENIVAPYHITDSTLSAEAIRLVNSKLSGARPLYEMTVSGGGSTKTYLAVKEGSVYYLVTCNDNVNPSLVRFNLSAWGAPAGTRVTRVSGPAGGMLTCSTLAC